MTSQCGTNPDKNVLKNKPNELQNFENIITGADKCITAEAGGTAKVTPWVSATVSASMSMGCENVSAIIDVLHNTRKNIVCILKTKSKTISNTMLVNQQIKIKVKNANCKNFKSFNLTNGTLVLTAQLTQEDVTEIKNNIKDSANKVLTTIQESDKAFGAPIQGSKSYTFDINEIDQHFEDTQVDQIIEDVANHVQVNQLQDLEIENLTGDNCEINNETLLNLTAQSMMDQAMSKIFQLDAVTDLIASVETSQKAKSRAPFEDSALFAVIAGVVILFVLGIGGYAYYKNKKTRRRQMRDEYYDDDDNEY